MDPMDIDEFDASAAKDERDEPSLVLFDAMIFKEGNTPASVVDLSTRILRAEGFLWIEDAHKMRLHKPNGSQCTIPFEMYSYERKPSGGIAFWALDAETNYWVEIIPSQQYLTYYGQLIASAELKHFVTDYYLEVIEKVYKDDLEQLCWEFSCEDGRGLHENEVKQVFMNDANSYFLITQFLEEEYVDEDTKNLLWKNTKLYKFLKKECPDTYQKAKAAASNPRIIEQPFTPYEPPFSAEAQSPAEPLPAKLAPIEHTSVAPHQSATPDENAQISSIVNLLIEDLQSDIGASLRRKSAHWLGTRIYTKFSLPDNQNYEGPRISKCVVYNLGTLLADVLERDLPELRGSAFVDDLRKVGKTDYPPFTSKVTSNEEWDRYLAIAKHVTLARRNVQVDRPTRSKPVVKVALKGPSHVKDLFTNKPPVGRPAVGRPTRSAQITSRNHTPNVPARHIPDEMDVVEEDVPMDLNTALQELVKLGAPEVINGRTVPHRLKRSGY